MELSFYKKSILIFTYFFIMTTIFSAPISEVIGVRYEINDSIFIETSMVARGLQFHITGQGPDAFSNIEIEDGILIGDKGTLYKKGKQVGWKDPSSYETAKFILSNKNWKEAKIKKILINYN